VDTGTKPNNVDNLNNERRETSIYFMNKRKEYLKAKNGEIETKIETKLLGICTGASMNLRKINSLELIY
jgi:hypothetical protein